MYELRSEEGRDEAILGMVTHLEEQRGDGDLDAEHEQEFMMELVVIGMELDEYCKYWEIGARGGRYQARHAQGGATDQSKRWFD